MPPIRFCFGLHLHQPVGNFGYVFEQHVRDVYLPFLERLKEHDFFPIALHLSGPLLDWLEAHDTRYLDLLGGLVAEGKLELLLAGYYEPILASIPRLDRVEQIAWLQEALHRRFGVTARGLWLTERVWEPDLAADLRDAGVDFALVDDRHFLVSGLSRQQLHTHYVTEHDGKRVSLFPIDEKLRYLVPFQPPADTAAYLRSLQRQGHQLAVLADDGEKFGGWPGTREWVFEKGWLTRFMDAMQDCLTRGDVVLSTFADALGDVPSGGLAYLGTASYREMEGWSLPAESAVRLTALEKEVGPDRLAGPEGALLRGTHWRNFLVKYAEANRMQKKATALSALCRARGNPPRARRAIGKAQCNDAYWHGVFGGLYLPFLRAAIWSELALAEETLRHGEGLAYEETDLDADGHPEIWIHSDQFSAIVSPRRGGAIEELSHFSIRENLADTLTRRRESYHLEALEEARKAAVAAAARSGARASSDSRSASGGREGSAHSGSQGEAAPSIHDTEKSLSIEELPPADPDVRSIFQERLLPNSVTRESFVRGGYDVVRWLARSPMTWVVASSSERVDLVLSSAEIGATKLISFFPDGLIRVSFSWDATQCAPGDVFSTELSLTRSLQLVSQPAAERWEYPIETVAKSEKGLDRTLQGTAVVLRWPASLGTALVELPVPTQRTWD
jgi:alpha-amylase/alpha-mannosidase (GH57 family)